ncbi:signal recognition particle protein [Acidaminobacterium chupaoyuni]
MPFEGLSEKLNGVFQKLRSRGRLTETDVRAAMREIRMALLEADVNFKVAKDFINRVTERAVGTEILESLTPAQQVIKIVNEELTALMGGSQSRIQMASSPPTVVMFVGLQGAGKTTNCAKLAGYYKKRENKRPLLCACDVYRPAAIDQLKVVGGQLDIPVFEQGQGDPVEIAKAAYQYAKQHGNDLLLIDTAGRLHIDEALMDELKRLKAELKPNEIMLVVDAMTGQDAVNAASAFNDALGIDSVLISKLDGDARGGAALSVRAVTGKPIKFCGTGEKLDAIEPFHPDRMASRLLGMGDVMSLIEKAQQNFDEKKAQELEKKMRSGKLTLTDFYDQLNQMKDMGSMSDIMGMLPGNMGGKALSGMQVDEKVLGRTKALIQSMTPYERDNPDVLNYSRKKRIAAGSGQKVEDLNRLLKQFEATQLMMKQLAGSGKKKMRGLKGFKMPF